MEVPPGPGADGKQREQFPEFQVSPVGRVNSIFFKADRPVGKGRGDGWRSQRQMFFPQGPRAKAGRGRRLAKNKRLCRNMGEFFLNQGGPAMMPDGVDAPVALDGGQLARRITDGINWQKEGIEPHGLRPGRGEGRAPRQNETLPRLQDAARRSSFKLGKKIREKSLRGQIDSKGTFHLRLSPEPRLRAAVGAVTRDAPARPCGCAVAKHEMRLYTVISSCAQQSHCSAARSIHTKGRSHAS